MTEEMKEKQKLMLKKQLSLVGKRKKSVAFESTYVIGDPVNIGMDVY